MEYRLNFEEIKKSYKFSDDLSKQVNLQHHTGKKIKLLPYKTKLQKDIILDFDNIIGDFSRLLTNKKIDQGIDKNELIKKVLDKVDSKSKIHLKDIINNLFYTEQGNLEVFHPIVFNYIFSDKKHHKNFARFLYDIFICDKLDSAVNDVYNRNTSNILIKLMLESLPDLKSVENQPNEYKVVLPYVQQVFQEDFRFILKKQNYFVDYLIKLLKYYYFFYVSQLSIFLNQFFDADQYKPKEIYFNLDWESTSKSRTSYIHGWEILKNPITKLFSHANCLELLNHTDNEQEQLTYMEIKEKYINRMTEEEEQNLSGQLEQLISLYKKNIDGIEWNGFAISVKKEGIQSFEKIKELFKVIDYQFTKGNRRGAYEKYSGWFIEFCKNNFLKQRGPLGLTLNINEDYLIFLTKLCIKDKQKIRLNKLFTEYERRGLFFDRDSKQKIIELFERLNLLEKKSDSGDAQYVRSIL